MSKIWVIILSLLLIVLWVGCGGKSTTMTSQNEAVESKTESQEEPKAEAWNPAAIAIYPFDVQDSKSRVSGQDVANMLMSQLIDIPWVEIVEREELENILNEIGLATSDLTDKETQIAVGRLLNAHFLIFGTTNKAINLITARVVQTETSQILSSKSNSDYKDNVKSIQEFAQLLQQELLNPNPKLEAVLQPHLPSPSVDLTRVKEVEVTGRGTVIDSDLIAARELALKDAYTQAIAQGAGVQLIRETQVENFQLVRDEIMARTVGYVAAYNILEEKISEEKPPPPIYEVVVSAGVSLEPLSESDIEKLQPLVENLLAKPKVAVLIDAEAQGENLPEIRTHIIQGQLISRLKQAGFSVLDAATVEERKKQLADAPDDKDAVRLGKLLEAEVTIRGSFSTNITTHLEELNGKKLIAPIVAATTTGAFQVINAETADVIYTFSHEDLADKSAQKGYGSKPEAAISQSLDKFIKVSADGLIMGFTKKLGDPVELQLELQKATLEQAEDLEKQINEMPEQVVLPPLIMNYQPVENQKGEAIYDVTTPSKRLFEKKLRLVKVEGKQIIPSTIGFRNLVMRLDSEATPPDDSAETDKIIHTGFVIDASELDVKKTLYPKIYDENLDLIYGDEDANRPAPGMVFWVEWAKTLDDAETHDRVKRNPLIIQARELQNGEIIVSSEDAAKINALETEYNLLQQGRVAIVISDLPHTGIIVDASGLDVKETLYPKIYDENLDLVYGDEDSNRPAPGMVFWVEWANNLSVAKTHDRVKGNPLIIHARELKNGGIVVDNEDAAEINAFEEKYHFLEQGKIVIVH